MVSEAGAGHRSYWLPIRRATPGVSTTMPHGRPCGIEEATGGATACASAIPNDEVQGTTAGRRSPPLQVEVWSLPSTPHGARRQVHDKDPQILWSERSGGEGIQVGECNGSRWQTLDP